MKLTKFRVTNFRSVDDSGWIDIDNITALVGTNESGKTNLLIPLWKLKPVRHGAIDPIADYPRKRYNEIRNMKDKPVFISAYFELDDDLAQEVSEMTNASADSVKRMEISRDFDGTRYVNFPGDVPQRALPKSEVESLLSKSRKDIAKEEASKSEESLKDRMLEALQNAMDSLTNANESVGVSTLKPIKSKLGSVDVSKAPKRSTIAPRYGRLLDSLDELIANISKPRANSNEEVRKLVIRRMPSFVYYANYGNLDSEIYLPHVIQNMERDDLGSRAAAKTRTLRVLFEYVKLSPQEILELGQEPLPANAAAPTDDQIQEAAERKTEREVLLQSASTDLTQKFRSWWKQGDYRLRFQADGNHFRIWVSDDRRPEEIELEGRSTGLQWFLSFYLVFLVESSGSHRNSILLLDEPGLSLHPVAQKDLSNFFENLSKSNQILYTAHSPFMVDSDRLDRVKAVYVNDQGTTSVSSDLRAAEGNVDQERSIYPVHAAIGLTASDTILYGCKPVIVEGRSDQVYLSVIKNYLISKGYLKPKKELVFIPSGGAKGISPISSIITGTEDDLPYAVLDSDSAGVNMANKLKSSLYQGAGDRLLMLGNFLQIPDAEIEDLFPADFLSRIIARFLRGSSNADEDFDEVVDNEKAIIPQVKEYASANGITLDLGWKVEVAKRVKTRMLGDRDIMENETKLAGSWRAIFDKIEST